MMETEETYSYHKITKEGRVFMHGRLGEPATCCGWVADFLCDFPVGGNKTCDAGLCEDHNHEIAPNIHYCDTHYKEWKEFVDSGGVKKWLENIEPFKKHPFFKRTKLK